VIQLDQLYQEIILDHYKNPHGRGLREPYDGEAHFTRTGNFATPTSASMSPYSSPSGSPSTIMRWKA
jgi:hypothetical protein